MPHASDATVYNGCRASVLSDSTGLDPASRLLLPGPKTFLVPRQTDLTVSCPATNRFLTAGASAPWCSTAKGLCSSAAAPKGRNTSTRFTPGRCRRAASTRARITWKAALRELYEETNIRSVKKLGEIGEWLSYDIPREIIGEAWGGKYRGTDAEVVRAALYRRR